MKQIVDKLNKIAKKIDESVEIPQTDLIIDSLDAITKAYGGTPNDSHLIVDKLEDIANYVHGGGGGGGDVSLANVTLITTDERQFPGIYTNEETGVNYIVSDAHYRVDYTPGEKTVQAILYKGKQQIIEYGNDLYHAITSHTGDVTVETEEIGGDTFTVLTIFGDCSLSVTWPN